jgi:hypothetical protein
MMYGHARTEGIRSKMISRTSVALWRVYALGKGVQPGHRPPLPLSEQYGRTPQSPTEPKQEEPGERDETS